jgi:hypothetical protein
MRTLPLVGVILSSFSFLAGAAHAEEPVPPRSHLFVGAGYLATKTTKESGTGATAELGYDFGLTPSSRVGLLVDASIDYAGYGADADALTWVEVGGRYTHLFRLAQAPTLTPFLSGGLSVGKEGGELGNRSYFTSLMLDAGIEWAPIRNFALDARLTERPARMSLPGTSWHNTAGVVVDFAALF